MSYRRLITAMLLPIPFAALPLLSLAVGIWRSDGADDTLVTVTDTPIESQQDTTSLEPAMAYGTSHSSAHDFNCGEDGTSVSAIEG